MARAVCRDGDDARAGALAAALAHAARAVADAGVAADGLCGGSAGGGGQPGGVPLPCRVPLGGGPGRAFHLAVLGRGRRAWLLAGPQARSRAADRRGVGRAVLVGRGADQGAGRGPAAHVHARVAVGPQRRQGRAGADAHQPALGAVRAAPGAGGAAAGRACVGARGQAVEGRGGGRGRGPAWRVWIWRRWWWGSPCAARAWARRSTGGRGRRRWARWRGCGPGSRSGWCGDWVMCCGWWRCALLPNCCGGPAHC